MLARTAPPSALQKIQNHRRQQDGGETHARSFEHSAQPKTLGISENIGVEEFPWKGLEILRW